MNMILTYFSWIKKLLIEKQKQKLSVAVQASNSSILGRDRRILGTHWPASLAEKAGFQFNKRLSFKGLK